MSKWIGILVAVVTLALVVWVVAKSFQRKPFTSIRTGGGGGDKPTTPNN